MSENMLKPILKFSIPPIYGSVDITFRDFMTPGMVRCVVFILAVGLTALSFVSEKKEGVMERTIMAGVRIYEILMTQIFVQIFVLFVQIVILLIIIFLIFSIENKGMYYYIIPLILMQGVLGMTYGVPYPNHSYRTIPHFCLYSRTRYIDNSSGRTVGSYDGIWFVLPIPSAVGCVLADRRDGIRFPNGQPFHASDNGCHSAQEYYAQGMEYHRNVCMARKCLDSGLDSHLHIPIYTVVQRLGHDFDYRI